MDQLSNTQQEIIGEFVDLAITKSLFSMQGMLNIQLRKDYARFGVGIIRTIPEFESLGRFKVHIIKVNLKGELGGALYFVINAYEVGIINKACLPEDVTSTLNHANKEMKNGFILEIENIIAASSVTEIADLLGVELLGAVPEVKILKGNEVNEYLRNESLKYHSSFNMEAVLKGIDLNISPYVIWMLDKRFMKKLKENVVEPD